MGEVMIKVVFWGVSLFFAFGALLTILEIIDYFKQDKEERNNPMMNCDSCDELISKMARYCPECGHDYGKHNWVSYVPIVNMLYLLGYIFGAALCAFSPYLIQN